MEIVRVIREAILFIEDNIEENITQKDVADNVFVSLFHFHRVFKSITGITPKEYIRNRKLSLAAEELTRSKSTVLDIALKYGYESHEGFKKAFYRFHGINPGKAKLGNVELKSYNPLKINISFEGGKSMEYRITRLEEFSLQVIKKVFNIERVSKDDNTDIPEFWDECHNNGTVEKLKSMANDQVLYGVCNSIAPNSEEFYYGIGVKSEKNDSVNQFENWTIKEGTWAVFKVSTPEDFGSVWDKISKEFLVNSKYERVDGVDFEYYHNNPDLNYFCEIWLPVKEKN